MGNFDITAVGSATTPFAANKVSTRFEQAAQPLETPKQNINALSPGQAVYFSPAFKYDAEAQVVIYVQRNIETGNVINQYPSKKVVEQYRQTAQEGKKTAAPLNSTVIVPAAPKTTTTAKTLPVAPVPTSTATAPQDVVAPVQSDV